jgi:hypothetical protein
VDILLLFRDIDDFCLLFELLWERKLLETRQRRRASTLCLSEVMTIIVLFHASSYRNFKAFYTEQVLKQYLWAFPRLVSYGRFVELMQEALVPLCGYLQSRRGRCSGVSFVDSTSLKVCHNRRIHSHKVFAGCARRGKTSVDWFFGFKLHLVINDRGELLSLRLTPGNVDDRRPVPELVKGLFGKLFGVVALLHWGLKKGRQSVESVGCHGTAQNPPSSAFPALPPLRRASTGTLLSQHLPDARRAAPTMAMR